MTRNWSIGRSVATVGAIAAALALLPATTASAAPNLATGGFVFVSDTQIPTAFPGGNVVLSEQSVLQYSGDLSGIAYDTDTFVVHADGSFQGWGTEVCSPCSLGRHAGTFTSTFTFRGAGDSYIGRETITGATGGLAGLHGSGTFQGLIVENTNSYAYSLHLVGGSN